MSLKNVNNVLIWHLKSKKAKVAKYYHTSRRFYVIWKHHLNMINLIKHTCFLVCHTTPPWQSALCVAATTASPASSADDDGHDDVVVCACVHLHWHTVSYFSGHRLDTGNHKANDVRYVHSVNMSSYARDRLGQWGSGDGVSPSTLSGLDRLRHPGVTKVWDCFVDNLLLVTWWNSTRALDDVATLLLTKHEPVRCGFFRAC